MRNVRQGPSATHEDGVCAVALPPCHAPVIPAMTRSARLVALKSLVSTPAYRGHSPVAYRTIQACLIGQGVVHGIGADNGHGGRETAATRVACDRMDRSNGKPTGSNGGSSSSSGKNRIAVTRTGTCPPDTARGAVAADVPRCLPAFRCGQESLNLSGTEL